MEQQQIDIIAARKKVLENPFIACHRMLPSSLCNSKEMLIYFP